jgi:hypothetical protein
MIDHQVEHDLRTAHPTPYDLDPANWESRSARTAEAQALRLPAVVEALVSKDAEEAARHFLGAAEVAAGGVTLHLPVPGRGLTEEVAGLDRGGRARLPRPAAGRCDAEAAIPVGCYGALEEFGAVAAFCAARRGLTSRARWPARTAAW